MGKFGKQSREYERALLAESRVNIHVKFEIVAGKPWVEEVNCNGFMVGDKMGFQSSKYITMGFDLVGARYVCLFPQ